VTGADAAAAANGDGGGGGDGDFCPSRCSSNLATLDGSVYDGSVLLLPTHVHAAQITVAQVTCDV
jgi:hypothetical protein